jgi:hypothetical protein
MANTKITNPELFNLGDSTSATQLPVMTTTERIAMTGLSVGETIFNSTTDKVEYWDGAKWYGINYQQPKIKYIYMVGLQSPYSFSSVLVFNVSDPSNIIEEDVISVPNAPVTGLQDCCIDNVNNVLYAVNDGSVYSIDISNPASIFQLGSLIPSYANYSKVEVDIANEVIYITSQSGNALISVDVSDPANMVQLDFVESISQLDGLTGLSLDLTNQVAYVSVQDDRGLASIDISNPSSMTILQSLVFQPNMNSPQGTAIDLENQVLYIVDKNTDSIISWNISNPSSMTQLGAAVSVNIPYAIAVDLDLVNEVAYVADRTTGKGITSFDISTPSNMSELGTFTDASVSFLYDVLVDSTSQVAYTYKNGSLSSVDISDPSSMSKLDDITTSVTCTGGGLAGLMEM